MSSPVCKNSFIPFRGNSPAYLSLSRPFGGAARDRHGRGTGCGGRGWRQRRLVLEADGEVVWSCRPDPGGKPAELSAGDGGKQARSPGRARRKPLKPLRRECRVFSGVTVVTTLVCFFILR